MNFIKNNLKVIIGFIIGLILASSITVYAYSYFASDIKYTNDKSVADALNDLYNKKKENIICYTGANNGNNGIESYTVLQDSQNALIFSGQASLMYSINSTDNFIAVNNEIGHNENGMGLYYKSNISIKKGDIIYLKRDTGSLWGYSIVY